MGRDDLIGKRLGPYQIERLLGSGAMGDVFLARHQLLARNVALKTLKSGNADRGLLERFFAEARAVNIIKHENIVECTDLVSDDNGRSYIVMELLEGRTLTSVIESAGVIDHARAARIGAQIADALGAAHGKGIVHRDIKPDNVFLIRRAGTDDYVKVLDFGIARLRADLGGVAATKSGALLGTPAYMSPEQADGEKVGPAADIYSLGAVLFHMLAGRTPFQAKSVSAMLIAHVQETPPELRRIVPGVPKQFAELVAAALSKSPSDRPRDMLAMQHALLEIADIHDTVQQVVRSTAPKRDIGLMATLPPPEVEESTIEEAPRHGEAFEKSLPRITEDEATVQGTRRSKNRVVEPQARDEIETAELSAGQTLRASPRPGGAATAEPVQAWRFDDHRRRGKGFYAAVSLAAIAALGAGGWWWWHGAHHAGSAVDVGCSDGTREALGDLQHFPRIAACGAQWNTGSLAASSSGMASCGDTGPCATPADACQRGWHVCGARGADEVRQRLTADECARLDGDAFVLAQPSTVCDSCGTGPGYDATCCGRECVKQSGDCVWPSATNSFGPLDDEACGEIAMHHDIRSHGVLCCQD